MSKFYFGCSNATSQLPSKWFLQNSKGLLVLVMLFINLCVFFSLTTEAQSVRRPNRYLLIDTSGGLNQQRIGVTHT